MLVCTFNLHAFSPLVLLLILSYPYACDIYMVGGYLYDWLGDVSPPYFARYVYLIPFDRTQVLILKDFRLSCTR